MKVKNSFLLKEKRVVSQRAAPRAVPEMRGWDSISQRAGSWCFYHHSVSSPRNSVWSQPKNPCSGQGCPRAIPQGPLVLPEAPGAAHFPGKMCAELTERSCCQAQPPGAPEWAQPWHLCTLIFPHLSASLPPSLPAGRICVTQRCLWFTQAPQSHHISESWNFWGKLRCLYKPTTNPSGFLSDHGVALSLPQPC